MAYHRLNTPGLGGWFLQRISAVFLAIGLFAHLWACVFPIDKPLTIAKIAQRLGSPAWVIFDCVLLLICIYHGLNGLFA